MQLRARSSATTGDQQLADGGAVGELAEAVGVVDREQERAGVLGGPLLAVLAAKK
jgi:hypothetical protein